MKYFYMIIIILYLTVQSNAKSSNDIDCLLKQSEESQLILLEKSEKLKHIIENIIFKSEIPIGENIMEKNYALESIMDLKKILDTRHKIAKKAILIHSEFEKNNPTYVKWLYDNKMSIVAFEDHYKHFESCIDKSMKWFFKKINLTKPLFKQKNLAEDSFNKIMKNIKKDMTDPMLLISSAIDNFAREQNRLINICLIETLLAQKESFSLFLNSKSI